LFGRRPMMSGKCLLQERDSNGIRHPGILCIFLVWLISRKEHNGPPKAITGTYSLYVLYTIYSTLRSLSL
jgi:hypothetical protein